jgi:hypothetical protein
MKKVYSLLFNAFLICCLSACQKNNNLTTRIPIQASFMVGKWNLQQQNTVTYVNDAKQTDTTYLATAYRAGHLQFNKDGTFNSTSYLSANPNGGTGSLLDQVMSRDSTSGAYTVVNSSILLNVPIAGFSKVTAFYDQSSTASLTTAVNLISKSIKVTLLTSSKLNIHMEVIYDDGAAAPKINKDEQDYYYTR